MSEQLSRGYRIFLKIRQTIELMELEAYGDSLIIKDIVVRMSPGVLHELRRDCWDDDHVLQVSYQTPNVYTLAGYPVEIEWPCEKACPVVIHFTSMETIGALDLETPWGPWRTFACIPVKCTREVHFEC